MPTLGIEDMLRFYGFDVDAKRARTKVVRHQDKRYPVQELMRNGWLELYQSYQSDPIFEKTDTVFSFYGLPGTRAGLYGVFENKHTHKSGADGPTPPECPWVKEWQGRCPYFYELERVAGYEPLERRLVIEWGKDTINWHKYLKNLPVLELLPDGRKLPVFEDYLEFRLSHHELRELFAHPEAHRDWRSALESVAGVYLILAEKTGDMYVGSAYGAAGIWGRWEQYAKTGHGGNKYLIDLLKTDTDYPGRFWFSLLQILPKSFTMAEVIKREEMYKRKLGTRAHGLHLN